MSLHLLVNAAAGAAYLFYIINAALLFAGCENAFIYHRERVGIKESVLAPFMRLMNENFFFAKAPKSLYCAFFTLIGIYYFLPVGSLPAFADLRGCFVIVVLLLVLTQNFYLQGLNEYSKKLYRSLEKYQVNILLKFTLALFIAYITFAWFALNAGIPGDLLCFSTYSSEPLYRVANMWGRTGLVFFFISIASVAPARGIRRSVELCDYIVLLEVFDAIKSMLGPAVLVSLFLVWNPAASLSLSGPAMFAADFAVYWIMVFAVQTAVIPAVRVMYILLQRRCPAPLRASLYLAFSALGVAGFMANMYL